MPSSVESAILKALDRKKKRRFSSIGEFAGALGVTITPAPVAESGADLEPGGELDPEVELEPEVELGLDLEDEAAARAARGRPPPLPPPLPMPSAAPATGQFPDRGDLGTCPRAWPSAYKNPGRWPW